MPALDKKLKHDIDVVVDRLVIKPISAIALPTNGSGARPDRRHCRAEMADKKKDDEDAERIFSARFACPVSGFTIEEIEPRLFSFNNPFGACPSCDGLGTQFLYGPIAAVPDGA